MKVINIPAPGELILRAGTLFDGHNLYHGRAGEFTDIIIVDGVIRQALTGRRGETQGPEGAGVIDLRGLTVLPGLVDCHVHLALDGVDFGAAISLWEHKRPLNERIDSDLRKTMSAGIMAVRDGGDRGLVGLAARDRVARSAFPGPRIMASGAALRRKGAYGSFLGPGLEAAQLADAVKGLADLGVDQIKVLVSGVVSFKNYRQVGSIQFSAGELSEIVQAAHGCGLRVMAHASSDEAVRLAVQAGVDSLEHGYFISRESLEAAAGAGTAWVPTLAPVANQLRGKLKDRLSPEEQEVIRKTCLRQQRMVKSAAESGVKLGVGTDAGATGAVHGQSYLEELLLMEEAGLDRRLILEAATAGGSAILGLGEEMGQVRPGLSPRLIAVRGNPMENLLHLKNIEFMTQPYSG